MLSNLPPKISDQVTDERLAQVDQRLDAHQRELGRQAEELLLLRDQLNDAQLWVHRLINGTVSAPVAED